MQDKLSTVAALRAPESPVARSAWLGFRSPSAAANRGLTHALLRWLLAALVLWLVVFFGRNLVATWLARMDYSRAVHVDRTVAQTGVRAQVTPTLVLVYRDQDGRRVRVVADQAAYSHFARMSLARLEVARTGLQDRVSEQLAVALEPTFTGMHGRVGDFADWYFAWGTSYRLMAKAAGAAVANALKPRAMSLSDSVAYALERYLQRHYEGIVLRPEVNDPRLRQTYRRLLASLHDGYLDVMAGLDQEFQHFVASQTTHLDESGQDAEALLSVDWESQRHKLSVAGHPRGGLDLARGFSLTAAGGLLGRSAGLALANRASGVINRGLATRLSAPYAGRLSAAAGGAVVGALGGPAGLVVGGAVGLGTDYLVNQSVELAGRENLESALHDGIMATQAELQVAMARSLEQAVQIWFDDSIQLLAAYP